MCTRRTTRYILCKCHWLTLGHCHLSHPDSIQWDHELLLLFAYHQSSCWCWHCALCHECYIHMFKSSSLQIWVIELHISDPLPFIASLQHSIAYTLSLSLHDLTKLSNRTYSWIWTGSSCLNIYMQKCAWNGRLYILLLHFHRVVPNLSPNLSWKFHNCER